MFNNTGIWQFWEAFYGSTLLTHCCSVTSIVSHFWTHGDDVVSEVLERVIWQKVSEWVNEQQMVTRGWSFFTSQWRPSDDSSLGHHRGCCGCTPIGIMIREGRILKTGPARGYLLYSSVGRREFALLLLLLLVKLNGIGMGLSHWNHVGWSCWWSESVARAEGEREKWKKKEVTKWRACGFEKCGVVHVQ